MDATVFLFLAAAPIGQVDGFAVPWARIALALLFCLTLAVGAIALLRRRSGSPALPPFASFLSSHERDRERELELVERLQLSAASQICLVRCGEERLLLHVSATGAQLLARIDGPGGGRGDR
jgi:flagellar biogenesis protein FliO